MGKTLKTFIAILSVLTLFSCEKWTSVEPVGTEISKPWDLNPTLWEKYFQSLKNYKQQNHFVFAVEFENGAVVQTSEKNRMRSLPDSLDMVILTRPDNFSDSDKEDMVWMDKVGTKVLYQIDLTAIPASELDNALAKAVSSVKENGLAGWSFKGTYRLDDTEGPAAASKVLSALTSAKTEKQVIVFQGNPLFMDETDRSKPDYIILNTEKVGNTQDLMFKTLEAVDYAAVPREKILLCADYESTILNESKTEYPAVDEISKRVVSLGPVCGLGVINISGDYYSYSGNYTSIRAAIRTLNP